jgi:hypothetical protein
MWRSKIAQGIQLGTMTAVCALAGAAAAQDMPATAAPAALQAASAPQAMPPGPGPAAPSATGPATPATNPLNQGQLDQLVAPIALYPDPLLSQVLMASTYPLEVVEAARWVRVSANAALRGDALANALKAENWDPSIMALAPFPRLLALMADKLQWTAQLGNAFLAQQADVMNAVQSLRHDAMAAGTLQATPQCHCVIQTSGNAISILPSDSDLVCIPVYNPRVAYGAWRAPEYPPDFFPIPAGFAFEPGYAIGFWPVIAVADFGPVWGWGSIDWDRHDIAVDRSRYESIDPHPAFAGNGWVHDPTHRGGVAYRDAAVTGRFGAARVAALTAAGRVALTHGAAAGPRFEEPRIGGGSAGRFGGAAAERARRPSGAAHQAGFARGPNRTEAEFHHGPVGRGPAPVRGDGSRAIGHANFAPARMGGGAHGGGPHGGPHGGGGHGEGGDHGTHH